MTRINCGVPPAKLSNKHLIAEHREIKRIPNAISSGRYSLDGQPDTFCLGKGHVKFFYNKLGYLLKRYKQIYNECKARGFNVTDFSNAWDKCPKELMEDYRPSSNDVKIVMKRIELRLREQHLKLS